MRIAYVSTYLPQQCGIATYTDYLIHGIREVDTLSEIKIIAEQGAFPIKQERFEVIPCWNRKEDYLEPIISQTKGIDIIHIQHEYGIYKFDERLPSVLQGLDINIKKIITIHCIRPAQFSERGDIDENFATNIAQLADQVIVHLELQKTILARLGIPSEKIHVIPHGTEISNEDKEASRKRLALPMDAKILLMFGFIKKHKCLHIVLEALVEILQRFKDLYLFVAGGLAPSASKKDRDYAQLIDKRIKELGLQKNVIYPNSFFPNEDVPYLFGASDIVLFPYYEEDRSASGSLHLALGAKKFVIASRIPKFEELKEVCDELLVLPYNASGIAKIALRLFEDQEFNQYVLDRTEKFRRRTSWCAVARKHLELYKLRG
ncbi:MAG: glycosyltransferase family 4 protein [Candidatus Marinimicrobia bacterium]|nr:glycosyltransferase family 4 protein [Candidatus Neomarinimicrobiota bacterium]